MNQHVLLLAGISLLVEVIYLLLPHLTRPDLFFAVTVDRGFRQKEEGLAILRRFRVATVIVSVAALVGIIGSGERIPSLALAFIFIQLFGLIGCFLWARAATLPYAVRPASVREAELEPAPDLIPGGVVIAFGPLALVLLTAVLAWLQWDSLPSRIPIHWGLNGPDRWIDRTPLSVAGFMAFNIAISVVLVLTILGTMKAVGRAVASGAAGKAEVRFRRFTVFLLLVISYLLPVPVWVALFAGEGVASSGGMLTWGFGLALVVLACVGVLMWMGQGGSRMASTGDAEPPTGDRRPDEVWKLGLIYFNPDDPAVFVEKRFGIGYTLNFGNRLVWLALVLLVPTLVVAGLLLD